MANKVKYFYHPSYSDIDWKSLNNGQGPYLAKGQLGVELDVNGIAIHMKVGPGNWSDLKYIEEDTYNHSDLVTNPIGDIVVGSSHNGRSVVDILHDMISSYQKVVLSSAKNNSGGGAAANVVVKEIGQSVDTSVEVSYTIANADNLKVGSNIFIDAGGIFTNEGWHTHTGAPIVLTLPSSLIPTSNVTYTINIYAVDAEKGNSNTISTTIVFKPTILWGHNLLQNISAAAIGILPNRLVSNIYKNLYTFSGNQYSHIYIPVMLNPADLLFSEQTNPSFPADYSMIPTTPSIISINNGTGTYDYYGFVSEFSLISATKLKID